MFFRAKKTNLRQNLAQMPQAFFKEGPKSTKQQSDKQQSNKSETDDLRKYFFFLINHDQGDLFDHSDYFNLACLNKSWFVRLMPEIGYVFQTYFQGPNPSFEKVMQLGRFLKIASDLPMTNAKELEHVRAQHAQMLCGKRWRKFTGKIEWQEGN